ncbi:permease-like cell division protein FtsX [Schnuerera sp. xch1]|uniref:cell division protein FtsX n=1 Tax=Schnuerera sp. xch1 TaxID=2874283 RepID=UPI001CBFF539|nr:permease-like cell division protein FtsX [Schnuerera sp. xch1]MBZ2175141.1 permease-like cell division protein FtsX [Schnuerera sp. xch1]
MKNSVYNLGYFLKEAKILFSIDLLSNIFSILSIGLIFFILALVISGWNISDYVIDVIEDEAEINVYYREDLGDEDISRLINDIDSIDGVENTIIVDKVESFDRMKNILGDEAHILGLFDENPFTAFIEVQIHIDESDYILNQLETLDNIDYIRDNKRVIDRLQDIVMVLKLIGILAITAVGISTLMVVSHIIRQGIYNNREQINTLELLGAPRTFIDFPFILEGVFLTSIGGVLASMLLRLAIKYGYGQIEMAIPFIPLLPSQELTKDIIIFIMGISGILGIIGSLVGVFNARNK